MKTFRALFALVTLALVACHSPERQSSDLSSVTCTCGRPEAVIDGCAHLLCVRRDGNPENPDCICGPMTLTEEGR
jgi:hypothetical protein